MLLPLVATIFTACQPKYENVAVTTANLLAKGEVEKAKEYLNEESKQLIDVMQSLGTTELLKKDNFQAKVVESEEENNLAKVLITDANDANATTVAYTLVKYEGKWYVDLTLLNEALMLQVDENKKSFGEELQEGIEEFSEELEQAREEIKEGLEEAAEKVEESAQKAEKELSK